MSPEQAATEASTLLQTSGASLVPRAGENQPPRDGPEVDVRVVPLLEEMVGRYRPTLLVLTAATALVLLITCINVAGLLLARGVTRQRMFALCAALGAGRGRLVRQLLTESVALSLIGGVLGLAAAAVVLRVVPALVPGDVARLKEVGIGPVTVAFTVGLSVFVGLLSGAAPALQSLPWTHWPRPTVRLLTWRRIDDLGAETGSPPLASSTTRGTNPPHPTPHRHSPHSSRTKPAQARSLPT